MPRVTLRNVLNATCLVTGVPRDKILSRSKYRKHTVPRHMAMYLSRELTANSYPKIGRFYDRDHSTILHAMRAIERLTLVEGLEEIRALVNDPVQMIPLFFKYGAAMEKLRPRPPTLPPLESLLPKVRRKPGRVLQAVP